MNKATLDLYEAKSVDDIIGDYRLSPMLTEGSDHEFVEDILALAQGKQYCEATIQITTLLPVKPSFVNWYALQFPVTSNRS